MEQWKQIPGFSKYQISNEGRVRKIDGKILSLSDDGNGYLKLMLYGDDGHRYCKKVHRLVAEVFSPRPSEDLSEFTVDHIRPGRIGKLDNRVANLQWMSRRENIQKAYADGVCDDRIRSQRKVIVAIDLWTNEETYFRSIKDASEALQIDRSSISHVLLGGIQYTSHYKFEYVLGKDRLLYDSDDYQGYQQFSRL